MAYSTELTSINSGLYSNKGFPVMLPWEKEYMEYCINMLHPSGDVLEIGFGLGYSANQIQKFPIRSHTIVECSRKVVKESRIWANDQTHPVNIIEGTWQNVLCLLGKFDTVFFDDCFLTEHPYEHNIAGFKYFLEQAVRFHSKQTTKIGWYCEDPPPERTERLFKKLNLQYELTEFKIKKPKNIEYAKKHKDVMFVPQLTYYG